MTRIIFLPVLSFVVLCACGQSNAVDSRPDTHSRINSTDTLPEIQFTLDTSVIAILPFDISNSWLSKDAKPTDLTNEELGKVEQLLFDCITKHNAKQDTTKQFSAFIHLKKYKRQYVPFINAAGERNVYVNCFCIANWGFENWKKTLVLVADGGSCFFQATINLTKLKCEQFSTNGYG
jgi:hypothetical protein